MRSEPADPDACAPSALAAFVTDIALSLAVHRGRSAALVWPEHEPTGLLDALATAAGKATGTVPAGPEADGLAGLLHTALGGSAPVRAFYAATSPPVPPGELLLVPLARGCDCRVTSAVRPPLRLRLRKGDVLYVPESSALDIVSGQPAPCPLLVLALPGGAGQSCAAPSPSAIVAATSAVRAASSAANLSAS
ncbi:hypothetical protein AB8O64_24760 [Streptomyces sp. QH1-20]|uniref:hypothetical protein n=1 Tax=Streptomyces sp. QH1-20 TaxID=3240934 RepID=UPI003511FD63